MRTIPIAQATSSTHFRGALSGGARVLLVRPTTSERLHIRPTRSTQLRLGFTVRGSVDTLTAQPAAVSPSDVEYQQLIAEWADAYDQKLGVQAPHQLESIYDDAYYEASDLQQELP